MAHVSLTRSQLETPAGLELSELLRSISEDGVLTNAELGKLRRWLDENRGIGFEGADDLLERLEDVLADGMIEHEERLELLDLVRNLSRPADE